MNDSPRVGAYQTTVPVPAVPENTVEIDAGPLVIGVEYRLLDEKTIEAHVKDDPQAAATHYAARESLPIGELEDEDFSVHVFGRDPRLEFLRFDIFAEYPHYHYMFPGDHHVSVGFDETANGDYKEWVIQNLGNRIESMLNETGGQHLAGHVDHDALDRALEEARKVMDRRRPAASS